MDWFATDYRDHSPTTVEVYEEVARLNFIPASFTTSNISGLVNEFDNVLTNGGVAFGTFAITGFTDYFSWFMSRNTLREFPLGRTLIRSSAARVMLGVDASPGLVDKVEFGYSDSLLLEGEIGTQLIWGGAYGRFAGTKSDARALAKGFCDDLMGERLDDFLVQRAHQQVWSSWHRSFIWTSTWLIVDKGKQQVSLLTVTDQD